MTCFFIYFHFLSCLLYIHLIFLYQDIESLNQLFHYQDYKSNEIDAVIELEDGNWCAIEIKLGLNKVEEGSKNLIKVCKDIVDNGGKEPIMKCVIYGVGNIAYKNADGVYIIPITALKP